MKLQYEISINGSRLRSQLRGVERELAAVGTRAQAKIDASASKKRRVSDSTESPRRRANALRDVDAEHRAKMRAILQEDALKSRLDRKQAAERMRDIRREHQAQQRRSLARIAREKKAEKAAAIRSRDRFTQGVARGTGGAARGMLGVGAGVLGLGGGIAAVSAIRSQMSLESSATVLANKAFGTPGETRDREQIRKDVLKQGKELGVSTGLGAENVVKGLDQFLAISGNLKVGQSLLPFLADIADATGADIGDVGRTGGQVVQAMVARGYGDEEAIAKTQNILAAMAGQAKLGSIEFADLATQMGKVMSSTAAFEGNIDELATTMGAISQLAISGAASSPEEAMTAILRFRDDLIQNAARFKKAGINVFADKQRTKVRDPVEIMVETLRATKGNLTKTGKLFGIRGMKAFQPFQSAFTEAGGGMKGVEAVSALLDRIRGATMTGTEIEQSAAFRREDPEKRLAIAVAKFQGAIGERLLPAVTAVIPEFEKLVPVAADVASGGASLAKWFMENPFTGVGTVVAASISKELAASGIQSILKTQFGGAVGKASLALAALAAGIAAIDWIAEYYDTQNKKEVEKGISDLNFESQMSAKVRGGGELTQDETKRLESIRDSRRATASKLRSAELTQQSTSFGFGSFGATTQAASGASVGKDFKKIAEAEADDKRISDILTRSAVNQDNAAQNMTAATTALMLAAERLEKSTATNRNQSMLFRGGFD